MTFKSGINVAKNGGRGGGRNLDKIQKKAFFFSRERPLVRGPLNHTASRANFLHKCTMQKTNMHYDLHEQVIYAVCKVHALRL